MLHIICPSDACHKCVKIYFKGEPQIARLLDDFHLIIHVTSLLNIVTLSQLRVCAGATGGQKAVILDVSG